MGEKSKRRVTSIGGQALIEGIMMRGPFETSLSVRMPDGSIHNEDLNAKYLKDKYKTFKLPIFRGIGAFIDSLKIGYKALSISAEKSGLGEDNSEPSKFDKWLENKFGDKITNMIMALSTVLGIIFCLLIFFVVPTWIFNLLSSLFPNVMNENIHRSIFEGILRIIIFISYVVLCSKMKDIKRVFEYHGAEHKTIFCYENCEELTVENVKKHSRFHPRCGTSFMIIMLILGILIGFFIPFANPFIRTFIKILCIPIVVGLGYELIKICGRYNNIITAIISAPGMWMQRITTKEPDNKMIEVAIDAIKAVIPENGEDLIK